MMPEEQPTEVQIVETRARLNWRAADDVPFHLANQFMVQYVQEGYILSSGQVRPPALLEPTQEEREAIQEVSVNVLGSVLMTPARARALMLLLRRQLERYSPELLEEALPEGEAELT